ncbi:MAG: double-strand break repair protein AddB, partial [Hyphomicrobiales bacterium]|nr:double-strand break repair protein AddB [Hyphomicrobiales bacterium]
MASEKTAGGTGRPRLYTIPPDNPFLETLAEAILNGDLPAAGGEPPALMDLPRWTVFLPTRRAARALSEAFLRVSGDRALLLPRIRPLGDVDEDEIALVRHADAGNDGELALSLPPAIGDLERRLALTRLVLEWSWLAETSGGGEQGAPTRATPAQASMLAAELAALMDTFDAEQVDHAKLGTLAPERFADHWQKTLDFLKIVTEHWPRHLEERGLMAPYARRDALMAVETQRLLANPPDAPVIAAGSTATVPATAALLEAIAGLPQGAVVLPGLDLDLDEESWQAIATPVPHPEHPQFGMRQFLARVGATRDDVMAMGSGSMGGRTQLVSQAMRPALTTDRWLDYANTVDREFTRSALEGVARIDAPGEQDEAEVISLLLRRAVEEPGCVAALVTPDRTLARRVSVRLEKWGLEVDDSAGTPLEKTLAGSFMDALCEAVATNFAPVTLLALLKHPMTRLGRSAADMRHCARLLELIAFRQPATAKGLAAHRRAVERMQGLDDRARYRHPGIANLQDADWTAVARLLDDLDSALAPIGDLFDAPGKPRGLEEFARAHLQAGEALACDQKASSAALWRGDAGEALADFFATLLTTDTAGIEIPPGDYLELYRSFVAGVPVRPRTPAHPRIHIWGPLEARLQRPDMVVLGGLNEGVWPASVETDPWLSRPMRAGMGLPAPERRIGLAAHDVAQLMGVARVYLTRAEKIGGAPTVPSRWLLRLDAVLDALNLKGAFEPDEPWAAWAMARDAAEPAAPLSAPAPCPPPEHRPKRLSVTGVKTWIANPYAIFARDILKLEKLPGLAAEPDAALRGTLIHTILQRFAQAYPDRLPDDIAGELMRDARALFEQFGDYARVETFWRGQLDVFARWFAATEPARRDGVTRVSAEVRGALDIEGSFTLSARADRIDMRADGTLAIYDYKTGGPPTAK